MKGRLKGRRIITKMERRKQERSQCNNTAATRARGKGGVKKKARTQERRLNERKECKLREKEENQRSKYNKKATTATREGRSEKQSKKSGKETE